MRRSQFDLSHEHKLSFDMGQLVPIAAEEVLPGDTFIGSTSLLARVAPLVNPVMHRVNIRVHHWYVPNRLLMPEWEDFITGSDDELQVPQFELTEDSLPLADHMGIAPKVGLRVNDLYFRAYRLIYNEMYRDQDLQEPVADTDYTIKRCAWQKDYFTTARPTPTLGEPINLGFQVGELPVQSNHSNIKVYNDEDPEQGDLGTYPNANQGQRVGVATNPAQGGRMRWGNETGLIVNLAEAEGAIDLDELRQALAMRRFQEARMRFGSRYIDYLRFLGVNPSDGRLDRPEYLGGGKQEISFSEVLATAEGGGTQVGDLYGHGIAGLRSRRYRKMFEEHGIVLSLISVRPNTVYMNAVHRKFTRADLYDYWQKEMEVQPWQVMYESEVHQDGDPAKIFGYVPKHEEYRFGTSYVSGSFRDGPEKDWHMGREFETPPTLNSSFIECDPTDRIYGDKNMPDMLVNAYNRIIARRLVRRSASLTGI